MKLTALPLQESSLKIAIALKKSTIDLLDSYQACYEETYEQPVTHRELIETIVVNFISSDKSFQSWRQAASQEALSAPKRRRKAQEEEGAAVDAE